MAEPPSPPPSPTKNPLDSVPDAAPDNVPDAALDGVPDAAPDSGGLPTTGAWAPLRYPEYRAMWLAVLVGNIGTWVNDVAAAWLMAGIGTPLMVAAVQSATTLPVVLLSLSAGALADIVDRRKYLILTQLWMIAASSGLAILAAAHRLDATSLLALTFALGIGAAMGRPAQAAATPELVPRPLLGPAAALGSVSMNIARSIGPALGGVIVAQYSIAACFVINAASFVGIAFVWWRWKPAPRADALPPERFAGALRAGLRYALHAPVFQAVLARAFMFFLPGSAISALLPILVRTTLRQTAGVYGLLLMCIGIGAVAGALLMPKIRTKVDLDRLILLGALGNALCTALAGLVSSVPLLCAVMLVNGMAWITVLSSFQMVAQTSLPPWVRARGLALYIMVLSLAMAIGSLVWGAVAQHGSMQWAMGSSAAVAVLFGLWSRRWKLGRAETLDVMPSAHWPEPVVVLGTEADRGPVMVTVEYDVLPAHVAEFHELMQHLGTARKRDGAIEWGVMEDTATPDRFLEYFFSASWLEHLRQHDRVTGEEARLQARVRRLLQPESRPVIRHFLGR
jgi:MFS family permease